LEWDVPKRSIIVSDWIRSFEHIITCARCQDRSADSAVHTTEKERGRSYAASSNNQLDYGVQNAPGLSACPSACLDLDTEPLKATCVSTILLFVSGSSSSGTHLKIGAMVF
jgi:hypothetical protein